MLKGNSPTTNSTPIRKFYDAFSTIIPKITPFTIHLTALKQADDGNGFVLTGEVEKPHRRKASRELLIIEINSKIRPHFNLSPRKYDTQNHNSVHCYIGYINHHSTTTFKRF
ncbi:hypothetical protein [Candidatus Harpocratesius sp.]